MTVAVVKSIPNMDSHHDGLSQNQVPYWLGDSGMLRMAVTSCGRRQGSVKITAVRRTGAAGSRTLTMLIKSQLYCLLILRPRKRARVKRNSRDGTCAR